MRERRSILVVAMWMVLPVAACGGRTHAGNAIDAGRDGAHGAGGAGGATGVAGGGGSAAPDDAATDTAGAAGTGAAGTGAAGTGAAGTGVAGTGVDAATDVTVDLAPVDVQPDGKANGLQCAGGGDCRLGHCVEGVCCESACTSKCTSCLMANTGKADGTCAAVTAGLPHGSDCAASVATTCGLDGKCDGAGACRSWASGTSCAVEACTDGAAVSNYSAARTCDGHGVCTAANTSTCGSAYRCTGTKCRTTCSGPQDCIPADYCSGTTCVAKKADGAVCASAGQCLTGVCGGRCCAAGCTCTLPSPTNLLTDPGFDTGTSGWTISSGTVSRSLSDSEHCPYSGSLMATIPAGAGQVFIDQCVRNTPLSGDFNFGGRYEAGHDEIGLFQVNFYSGFNCDADLVAQNETDTTTALPYDWQELSGTLGGEVIGANSVDFKVYTGGSTVETSVVLDQLYISKTPSQF